MTHSLLVVEGAHDASFFGHLAHARGYRMARTLPCVPAFWKPLIPIRYPLGPEERLDRVIRFPDIYSDHAGNTLGISAAGGDGMIISILRSTLEALDVGNLAGIGVVYDTDYLIPVNDRFSHIISQIETLNQDECREGIPGFPLQLPTSPGLTQSGRPKLGIYLLPDNRRNGILETILLECAETDHSLLERSTSAMVRYIDSKIPSDDRSLHRMRSASGRQKTQAGIIANILRPGASLAVSIQHGDWLGSTARSNPSVIAADNFLTSIL